MLYATKDVVLLVPIAFLAFGAIAAVWIFAVKLLSKRLASNSTVTRREDSELKDSSLLKENSSNKGLNSDLAKA